MRPPSRFSGVFDIETLEMMEGDLPRRAQKMVREWAQMYRSDLLNMWETQEFKKLPELK